jgi:hypothetical protein
MSTNDFWADLIKEADFSGEQNGSIDAFLTGSDLGGERFNAVQALTDKGRVAQALALPVVEGTRVYFKANLGAVLTYPDPPSPNTKGTVVTVKSAGGPVTHHEGVVFVQFDDDKFRSIHAEHLRLVKRVKASPVKEPEQVRVASLGDLTDFLKLADDTLIQRSTRDLWSFRRDGGEYVIERLFDATGEPVKG